MRVLVRLEVCAEVRHLGRLVSEERAANETLDDVITGRARVVDDLHVRRRARVPRGAQRWRLQSRQDVGVRLRAPGDRLVVDLLSDVIKLEHHAAVLAGGTGEEGARRTTGHLLKDDDTISMDQ